MLRSVFIVLILFEAYHCKRAYDINMSKLEVNPDSDPEWADKGTLRVTQKTRNVYVASGSWSLFKNVGNEIIASLTLYRIAGTGNAILQYQKEGKLCEFLKNEKMLYPSLVAKSNLPPPDTCPFPKGNYTITDFVIEEDQLPEEVPIGSYTGTAQIKSHQTVVIGFDFAFTVEAV